MSRGKCRLKKRQVLTKGSRLGSSGVEQAAVNRWVVGSNPSQDAKWPVRLTVRTLGFQPRNTSSILVRATINCGEDELVHTQVS